MISNYLCGYEILLNSQVNLVVAINCNVQNYSDPDCNKSGPLIYEDEIVLTDKRTDSAI